MAAATQISLSAVWVARSVFFLHNWATFEVLLLVKIFCGLGLGRAIFNADGVNNIYNNGPSFE